MYPLLLTGCIEISDDKELFFGYYIPIIVLPRIRGNTKVSRRTNQQLKRQLRTAPITAHECNCSSIITTSALATNRDSCRITLELCCMNGHPICGSVTIFQCRGKRVFGSQTVIDGHHQAICPTA